MRGARISAEPREIFSPMIAAAIDYVGWQMTGSIILRDPMFNFRAIYWQAADGMGAQSEAYRLDIRLWSAHRRDIRMTVKAFRRRVCAALHQDLGPLLEGHSRH